MLQTRILTAVVVLPIVIGLVFAGGWWSLVLALGIAIIAGWEFGRMMQAGGYHTTPFFTLTLILLLLFSHFRSDVSLELGLSVILLGSLVWQLFKRDSTAPTADWALTLAGGLYIGWGMGHLVALRQLADGLAWVWLTLLATWGADTFAYLIGRQWGRHKLWPRHSPKKSWEGLGGSFIGGLGGALIVVPFSNLSWNTALVLGIIIPIVALFGDLAESMMKRHVGVKDSSELFPGHGGFLDRIDSLLFVSIVVYYYAVWNGVLGMIPNLFR